MSTSNLMGPWVRRFLVEHLVGERNLSRNTQASYRDTLIQVLPFIADSAPVSVDRLTSESLTAEAVKRFLSHLELDRKCSIATRNQRLAALHAFAQFVGRNSPEHLPWCNAICSIPFKKCAKPVMCYMDKHEIDAILDVADLNSAQGTRDYALLLFLYNTGARADEAAQTKVGDLQFGRSPSVKITGKGNKTRYCPLWQLTANVLEPIVARRQALEPAFLNCRRQAVTRFGIHTLVKRYAAKATDKAPSLSRKRISPHSIRHSTAVHLLRAGVDINTIRAWLGHVSLDTTHIYAEVDLEMKARALSHCEILSPLNSQEKWRVAPEIMSFLKSL